MNELQAAGAAISSLKAAFELSKTVLDVAGAAKVGAKVVELQREILAAQGSALAAQGAQTALLAEVDDLKKQIVKLKDWEREKERYQLQAVDIGAFAYMLKPGMENGEPAHWLCANCFGDGQRSFLQSKGQVATQAGGRGMHAKWGCPACRAELNVYYTRKPSEPWAPTA